MKTTVPRDEQLKRAAQLRAIIMSTLSSNAPIMRSDLYTAIKPTMDSLKYAEGSLDNFLYTMTKSGLISKGVDNGKVVYAASGTPLTVKPKTEKVKSELPKTTSKTPAITIDIVKSTGRVRVAFNGLVVEIGVIK